MSLMSRIWDRIKGWFCRLSGKRCGRSPGTHVLVVGMEKSASYGGCPGSRVDATRMSKILSAYGDVKILLDGGATRKSVSEALSEALQGDLCIFYYSGHGGQHADPKGQGGKSEYLCLDDGPLPDYDIWRMISAAKGRVFMVFDCCHSATMFRSEGFDAMFRNTGFKFGMLSEAALALEDMDLLIWSGCPADDYSYGDADGGVFTNGIRKGLGKKSPTYDSVWETARDFAKSQRPSRTMMGAGFSGPVFR